MYVVYTGIEDGAATFVLCERDDDRDRSIRRLTLPPEDVPEGTSIEDHFWVEIDENGEIIELQFDPSFTAQKSEEYQDAVETHKQIQERERQRLDDTGE